ncbi:MAG: undecaprenyl/decaprenyl-phosphate alpha-N-acetylglucosaminyl 1-phosphate transferase, partial [Planctomycetaceae bacterium]|nr:undecaprenyl/decaprenyl-phosphate alpha-N-acetylglucosaminyl 1-phosphate transferase [Planctomycetaceae bacterium]
MDYYQFVLPTALAFATSYLLCGAFGWLARRIGFVDKPNEIHKKQRKATPLLGGVAVLTSFFLIVGIYSTSIDPQVQLMLMSTGCMGLLGLTDDHISLAPRTKLIGQVLICLPAAWIGFPLTTLNGFGLEFSLGSFAPLFVLLWLTACSNAINLLDGLDGVVGTVGIAICASIVGVSFSQPTVPHHIAELSIWLAACLLGFLLHNWYPARLYLGDAGSLSIGLLLGMLSLRIETNTQAGLEIPGLLMLFAVPLVDMVFAMTRRILSGRSVASPDNEHLHHRLHAYGFHVPYVALVIFVLAICCGLSAVLTAVGGHEVVASGFCLSLFVWLAALGMFGDIEARYVWKALRQSITPAHLRAGRSSRWVSVEIQEPHQVP